MIDPDVMAYAMLLWSTLVQAAPKDTQTLANNIKMRVKGDQVNITVSEGVPYAGYLNDREAICKRHHKTHYHWVQVTAEQIGEIYASRTGGRCISDYND